MNHIENFLSLFFYIISEFTFLLLKKTLDYQHGMIWEGKKLNNNNKDKILWRIFRKDNYIKKYS